MAVGKGYAAGVGVAVGAALGVGSQPINRATMAVRQKSNSSVFIPLPSKEVSGERLTPAARNQISVDKFVEESALSCADEGVRERPAHQIDILEF